jgi:type IV pilus assembly protein PilM
MALSLTRKGIRGTVGLDIDGGYLAAVETSGQRVERAVSTDLPAGIVSDGEVTNMDGLASALKEFFRANDLPKNVWLGIANQQIVVREIELPMIEQAKERDMAVRFQAAEAIAMPMDEAVVDYQVIGTDRAEDGSERMRVVVVAARSSMVSSLVHAVTEAGLTPEGVDLDAFALVRTLAQGAVDEEGARVYCHLAGVTNLAIARGSSCLFTRPLSTSWDDPEAAASALADEIRLSIDYYMAQPQARPVADVVLSGPGSRAEGLAEELGRQIGLPVSVAAPLGSLDSTAVGAGEDPHRYTVAAGLAMGAAA